MHLGFRELLPTYIFWSVLYSSFSFSGFNLMSLIHFELTFVKSEIISFFHMLVSSFSETIVKYPLASSPVCMLLTPLPSEHGFISGSFFLSHQSKCLILCYDFLVNMPLEVYFQVR